MKGGREITRILSKLAREARLLPVKLLQPSFRYVLLLRSTPCLLKVQYEKQHMHLPTGQERLRMSEEVGLVDCDSGLL